MDESDSESSDHEEIIDNIPLKEAILD